MPVAPAGAVTIWGVGAPRNSSNEVTGPNQLFTFDSATPGNVTVVGSTGLSTDITLRGLDFDAAGNLYAYGENNTSSTATGLYSLNTSTGVASFIGGGGLDPGDNSRIHDLAFNPATGKMMGVGNTGVAQDTKSHLYDIDLTTGLATEIGDIVPPSGFLLPFGFAADASGRLFVIDTLSGSIMELVGLNAQALPNDVGYNPFGVIGLTIDWSGDGTFYLGGLQNLVPFQSELRTVNGTTGDTTLVGAVGSTGYEFFGPQDIAIRPVPEPETAAMVLVGLLVLVGSRAAARRRPPA
ncbi:MAG: DUF4394 domain-containing protein [Hyphomicrobiales bacterium]|nr:DUF4394 domain-containing protein [Hyphomicrobiales bacterium]MCP5372814.1 DUF4394 domain-containing protein [Hyphomicrobiales bacterium]